MWSTFAADHALTSAIVDVRHQTEVCAQTSQGLRFTWKMRPHPVSGRVRSLVHISSSKHLLCLRYEDGTRRNLEMKSVLMVFSHPNRLAYAMWLLHYRANKKEMQSNDSNMSIQPNVNGIFEIWIVESENARLVVWWLYSGLIYAKDWDGKIHSPDSRDSERLYSLHFLALKTLIMLARSSGYLRVDLKGRLSWKSVNASRTHRGTLAAEFKRSTFFQQGLLTSACNPSLTEEKTSSTFPENTHTFLRWFRFTSKTEGKNNWITCKIVGSGDGTWATQRFLQYDRQISSFLWRMSQCSLFKC